MALPPRVPPPIPQDNHHHQQDHHWLNDYFHHHQSDTLTLSPQPEGHNDASWVDEFVEFSAARRGAQRHSIGDFIELNEFPGVPGDGGIEVVGSGGGKVSNEFERFDDEQLMSMFGNEAVIRATGTTGNSSSSDRHSGYEEKPAVLDYQHQWVVVVEEEKLQKNEQQEVDSSWPQLVMGTKTNPLKNEPEEEEDSLYRTHGELMKPELVVSPDGALAAATAPGMGSTVVPDEHIVDPKRVKRILANRQSAQRSRVRKLQYISELERRINSLQTEVSTLSPRVAFLDHQRMLLNMDNSTLKAKIAALAQDKIFKDANQEALKREIERLRQVYYQQTLNMAANSITPTSTSSPPSATPQPVLNEEQLIT
ncbi:hypothetical protein Dimus_019857 [Dionaea muscipula]